jgi:hypothetical protein
LPPKKNHKLFFKRLKNIRISIQTPGVRPDPRAWPWPRAADTWRWVCPSLGDRDRSARLAAEPSERVHRLACLTTNTGEGAQARAPRCADPRVRATYPGGEWRPVLVCCRIARLGSADPRAWLQTQGRGSVGLHAWLQTHARRSTDPRVKAAYPSGGRKPGCRTARLNTHPPVRSLLTCAGVLQQVHLPWTWSPTKSRVHLDLAGGCADLSA